MARGGIAFELERFGWTGEAPVLEVVGRWRGPRPRRLGAATLVVLGGGRLRLTPMVSSGDVRVNPEPELWRAEFLWTGTGVVEGGELEVGPSLVIELPAPEGSAPVRTATAVEPSGTDALRLELDGLRRQAEADRAEADRLRAEVAPLRRDSESLTTARAERDAARTELGRLEANARKFDASLAAARKDADAREQRARSTGEKRAESVERDAGGRASAAEARARVAEEEREAVRERLDRATRDLELAREDAVRLARERDGAAGEVARLQHELSAARSAEREWVPVPEPAPLLEPEPELVREPEPEREPVLEPEPTATWDDPPAAVVAPREPEPEPSVEPEFEPDEEPDEEPDLEPDPTETLEQPPSPRSGADAEATLRVAVPPRARQSRPPLQPHRTPPVAPHRADKPPKDSTALRAIAGAFVLLLAIVLLVILVIVA